jgi:hypothetical protein
MIPKSNTEEAGLLIEQVMKERSYPCSPASAARAGYEAAYVEVFKHITNNQQPPSQSCSIEDALTVNSITDEQILSCIPLSSIGKPMVWLTQKDVVLAIKNAINILNTKS